MAFGFYFEGDKKTFFLSYFCFFLVLLITLFGKINP